MALTSLYNDEPEGLTPEQESEYEGVYLTRRACDPRHWLWPFFEPGLLVGLANQVDHVGRGDEARDGHVRAVAHLEEHVHDAVFHRRKSPTAPRNHLTNIERRESLRDMARRIGAKSRRA
jgi:hypothetical protein